MVESPRFRCLLGLLSCFILFPVSLVFGQEKVERTEKEVLWMRNPAISPDGESIVFSYKGDLFKVPSKGGKAIPLTSHDAHETEPVWSQDGSYIAFASNRYGNYDIFLMPAEGGNAERLTYHSSQDHPYAFSEDDQKVFFSSWRLDDVNATTFPHSSQTELYEVPVEGGRPEMVMTVPAEQVSVDASGKQLLYQDRKGGEDRWRKHHRSSIARDVWLFNRETEKHRKLTSFDGEDRDPVWIDEDSFYYLSERSGDFNIWKYDLEGNEDPTPITSLENHPVRFLSLADNGTLCFGYDGRIFLKESGMEPTEVEVTIQRDRSRNKREIVPIKGDVQEMALSPSGKEIAFIVRGEVFVTSTDYTSTKRITNTSAQERSVSFHPDGRSLVYASERDSSWNIYRSSLHREEEEYFHTSTVLKETPLIVNEKETFQPRYSPDGKELAYLEDRTELRVRDLEKEKDRTILPGNKNYSYADGDQWYDWSPDGDWFLVQFVDHQRWPPKEVGLVKATGEEKVINLTHSGYTDVKPQWMNDGEMMIWFSDRHGRKPHGGMGGELDVYGMFFTHEAWDRFNMDKVSYELWKEKQKDKKGEKDEAKKKKSEKELDIQLDNLEDRQERLTIHSSKLAGAVMASEGEKLYYLIKIDKGYDLWVHEFYEEKTKKVVSLGKGASELTMDRENNKLYVLSKGRILEIDPKKGKKKPVKLRSEMAVDQAEERRYIFEHIWRQTRDKFYVEDMHGVDWDYYYDEYEKFLPHINNGHDFATMLSEMLGELNASHTGARYRDRQKMGDKTASLGLYFDGDHQGDGLKVAEVIDKGPLDKASSKVEEGVVLEKIDGEAILEGNNHYPLLNRKKGENTLLSFYDPNKKKRWEEVIQPISRRELRDLRYERWVERREQMTHQLSGGKIGYVHVRYMMDPYFRKVYEEVLGRFNEKDAIIVDTRFNGGGWLHDDLATFLSGEQYLEFSPRGQENLGGEPLNKWTKPSAVLMNEGNYSDAHLFPYVYKKLDIGKLIGMPVPGTGTAVWWEGQMNKEIVFGIPQVGMKTQDDELLENQELQPDIKVDNPPEALSNGLDPQLKKAVEVLLEE